MRIFRYYICLGNVHVPAGPVASPGHRKTGLFLEASLRSWGSDDPILACPLTRAGRAVKNA